MNAMPDAPWWRAKRSALLSLLGERECAYVYDLATIDANARAMRGIQSVSADPVRPEGESPS